MHFTDGLDCYSLSCWLVGMHWHYYFLTITEAGMVDISASSWLGSMPARGCRWLHSPEKAFEKMSVFVGVMDGQPRQPQTYVSVAASMLPLGCFLPGKVICLPDPKIQEYPVLPGKTIFTVFLPGKKSKSKLILRQ